MGCWNGTCAVSNLHVTHGTEVAVFLLLKNSRENSFCYGNALYDVCPVPFYGKYDDYGGVEECYGFGLPIVLNALKEQLYEFGQGPNEYHDCEVRRDNLDIELLFQADGEGRLAVNQGYVHDGDSYDFDELKRLDSLTSSQQFELDRLANKIKGVDAHRAVTHVIIHGDVFKSIINGWYIEKYVGEGKGNKGYNNSYTHFYFSDLKASISEYISRAKQISTRKKEAVARLREENLTKEEKNQLYGTLVTTGFDWNDPCEAGRWLEYFRNGSDTVWGLIRVNELVDEYIKVEEWENLEKFVTEVLTAAWINSFMQHTRKIWTKQTGAGSQSQEPVGYILLADTVKDILKAEHEEYGEDDNE